MPDAHVLEPDPLIDSFTNGVPCVPSLLDGQEALILARAATRSAIAGEPVIIAAAPHRVPVAVR